MSHYYGATNPAEHFAPHETTDTQDSNTEGAAAGYAGGAPSTASASNLGIIQQGSSGEYLMPNVLEGDVANDGVGNRHSGVSPESLWERIRTSPATSLSKNSTQDLVEGTPACNAWIEVGFTGIAGEIIEPISLGLVPEEPYNISVEAVVAKIITTATRYQNSNWIALGIAWLVRSESQLALVSSTPTKAHQLWMDTNSLARYVPNYQGGD
eukprot:11147971-Heterocapsa_arctica.AAC.1